MNNYELKDKIQVTEALLNELISKYWQEAELVQQQINNIDTNTALGAKVAKLLKNACTNCFVTIGCLETLADNPEAAIEISTVPVVEPEPCQTEPESHHEPSAEQVIAVTGQEAEEVASFEPFEYFVDFDEPSGDPLSDKDLYG